MVDFDLLGVLLKIILKGLGLIIGGRRLLQNSGIYKGKVGSRQEGFVRDPAALGFRVLGLGLGLSLLLRLVRLLLLLRLFLLLFLLLLSLLLLLLLFLSSVYNRQGHEAVLIRAIV